MATNSSQAGFLASFTVIPMDKQLEDILNPTIAGITGLNGDTQVRPRYQEDPPTQPDRSVDWVAFGVNRVLSENWAAVVENANQTASVIRYQELEVLFSWYGPNGSSYAEAFRDGLQIGQNRDLLNQNDIGLIDIGEARKAPALFKEKWLTKYDQTILFRRRTERVYPILTLLGYGITLNTDPVGETPITINYP